MTDVARRAGETRGAPIRGRQSTGARIGYTEAELDAMLLAKAPLASPVLTGVPTAPTAAPGTNTSQLATTAFAAGAIAALVNSAPGTLDTLKELADALGDDANFAASVTTALAGKQPLDAQLTDLAALAYGGNSAKAIRVKSDESGFELYTPAGGVNTVDAQVDFGSTGMTDYAEATVAAAWVGAGSNIIALPGVPATTDHDAVDALLEQLSAGVISINPGVSFVLGVHAPCGTWGRHDFTCLGA